MNPAEKIEIEFTQRPVDVPADLRLYRRLAMVCISVSECCRAGSASFKQLHFINSLFINEDFRGPYMEFRSVRFSPRILAPSADPYLNRCVNYAMGAGLLDQKDVQRGFRVELTDKGTDFVKSLRSQQLAMDVFALAREVGRISENEVQTVMREGI
ncbi:hypothetical protein [Mesorhizobium sp. M5C.F.Ca.IN.020.32.2.1]|uniref:hypothetical protein n=1 Tax=Mesorhizobium sp. M5C.F.Ca.IN.020.32.2.1 TaxID=2496771 RepID=UPI000FD43D03|nr:hypothetical protein [Mesorhizobium sp. M5C.F.Ca.IN.020.32.2.1]RUV30478.1 hypothetical protein EOA86_10920 [Mesorhizobium sp. M5C.F.Ca.IN.020.32.2.1]